MYFQDMFWSELDNWDLLYGAFKKKKKWVSFVQKHVRRNNAPTTVTAGWLKIWQGLGCEINYGLALGWAVGKWLHSGGICVQKTPQFGRKCDRLFWACVQNPGRNQEQTTGIILIYIIFWQSTLSLYRTHTLFLLYLWGFVIGITYYPVPYPYHPNLPPEPNPNLHPILSPTRNPSFKPQTGLWSYKDQQDVLPLVEEWGFWYCVGIIWTLSLSRSLSHPHTHTR